VLVNKALTYARWVFHEQLRIKEPVRELQISRESCPQQHTIWI